MGASCLAVTTCLTPASLRGSGASAVLSCRLRGPPPELRIFPHGGSHPAGTSARRPGPWPPPTRALPFQCLPPTPAGTSWNPTVFVFLS